LRSQAGRPRSDRRSSSTVALLRVSHCPTAPASVLRSGRRATHFDLEGPIRGSYLAKQEEDHCLRESRAHRPAAVVPRAPTCAR
jgi:hypothetical protein